MTENVEKISQPEEEVERTISTKIILEIMLNLNAIFVINVVIELENDIQMSNMQKQHITRIEIVCSKINYKVLQVIQKKTKIHNKM